ncbi:MAG: hypothetical protein FH756_05870 [Firmicutes bacterium]|nr:hypothetical protein [Bacillota bacterium]
MPLTIPEYITVKTAAGVTAAYLSPEADGLKDVWVNNELNGRCTLNLSLPLSSEKWQYLNSFYRIYAPDITGQMREFVILNPDAIEKKREGKKLWGKVTAHESWVLLGKQYADPGISNDPQTPSPSPLAIIILSGGSDLSGGQYAPGSAGHALYTVLQGTGWSVGTVDVTGIHDLETEKKSLLANINQIQKNWGGYLIWDSMNKTVSLRSEETWAPYTGYQVRYAKNLKGITRNEDTDIVTKLYPFGADDLDISSVNGGQLYIENYSYTSEVLSEIWTNQDIEDPKELKDEATKYLEKKCKPRYNYRVKHVDLRLISGYQHEDYDQGHMIDVLDEDLGVTGQARIIKYRFNVFQPWNPELEVGDPIEEIESMLNDSRTMVKYLNSIKTSKEQITAYKLVNESLIAEKIAKAAVDATKLNTKVVVLLSDGWTDNSPAAGSVSWNQHKLYYAGQEYVIQAGNTAQKYIYWDGAANAYATSATEPALNDGQFIIAVNNGGLHDTVWDKGYAREFIGSAFIAEAAILSAHIKELQVLDSHIANLAANKLTAGVIGAGVVLSNEVIVGSAQARELETIAGAQAKDKSAMRNLGPLLKLDGQGSGQFVQVIDDDRFMPEQITLECWVYKMRNSDTYSCEVIKDTSYYMRIRPDNNDFEFRLWTDISGDSGNRTFAGNVSFYEWHHLACTFDGTYAKGYLDGEYLGSFYHPGKISVSAATLQFGSRGSTSYLSNEYLDEIRIWDYARTEQQIKDAMYQELTGYEEGLLGYWKLNEGVGSIVKDSSLLNTFFNFGGNRYFQIPDHTALNPTTALTMEAWVRVSDTPNAYGRVIHKGNGNESYQLQVNDNFAALVQLFYSDGTGGTQYFSFKVTPNKWEHLAFSWDGYTANFYANGELTNSITIDKNLATTSNDLFIGQRGDLNSGTYFIGDIAEVRLWNVGRTQAQIQEFMHKPLTGLENGLIGYWRLNEGEGDVANSATPLNHYGTLHGTSNWVNTYGQIQGGAKWVGSVNDIAENKADTAEQSAKDHADTQVTNHNNQQSPHNLPSYTVMTSDGIKVFDNLDQLRVWLGQYAAGEYGLLVNKGKIYATSFQSGEQGATDYVMIGSGWSPIKLVKAGESAVELWSDASYGGYIVFSIPEQASPRQKGWVHSNDDALGDGLMVEAVDENASEKVLLLSGGHTVMYGLPSIYLDNWDSGINGGDCDVTIWGDLYVTGTMSAGGGKPARQKTVNYGDRDLYAREGPDLRYITESSNGYAQFTNGECRIDLNPIFLECIEPNSPETQWNFWFTPMFEFMDICVIEVGDTYFVVKEKNGSNGCFCWMISAIRKGYAGVWLPEKVSDDEEVLTSNWEDYI